MRLMLVAISAFGFVAHPERQIIASIDDLKRQVRCDKPQPSLLLNANAVMAASSSSIRSHERACVAGGFFYLSGSNSI